MLWIQRRKQKGRFVRHQGTFFYMCIYPQQVCANLSVFGAQKCGVSSLSTFAVLCSADPSFLSRVVHFQSGGARALKGCSDLLMRAGSECAKFRSLLSEYSTWISWAIPLVCKSCAQSTMRDAHLKPTRSVIMDNFWARRDCIAPHCFHHR